MTEQHLFTDEQREEIKQIVRDALLEFFKELGPFSKNFIIAIASVIAAITVIVGGVKTLLAWLGLTFIIR